jgi:hypothetical protein
MHATDAGCNKCKKCGKSEKYEKCDNFETLRNPPRAARGMQGISRGLDLTPPREVLNLVLFLKGWLRFQPYCRLGKNLNKLFIFSLIKL